MGFNAQSAMALIDAYSKTPAGKKAMDDKIKSYINGSDTTVSSTGKTYGGGRIMTRSSMKRAAKELISILRASAAKAGMPASVMEHIESFDYTDPFIAPDGSTRILIYMTDDPKRESLYPEKYDGVDNIVAIFNNGYTADGSIYGKWHGKRIQSREERQGSFFMQKAIDSFLDKYSEKFDISVELNPLYDGAWG